MERLTENSLAALVDGERIDWSALERMLGANSAALARLRRVARLIDAFAEAHAQPAAPLADAGIPWGHLRVYEKIGTGSYGEVHRAFDPVLEREVALKLRHDQTLQPRVFIAEARRLARVRHANVLAVHGAAIHEGRAGLWADLIVGRTLSDWIDHGGPRPLAEILTIARELTSALRAVHAAGLVHGDVKPGNIMREHCSGRTVLMDFGSAGERADAERHGGLLGSPASMAPEQLRGEPVGASADLYGLGVVLFFLATGCYPVASAAGDGRPAPTIGSGSERATVANRALPRAFRTLLSALLSPQAAARPDAGTVLRRLDRIAGAPMRRRKRLAVAAVIASLTLALSVSLYALVRVKTERDVAQAARRQEAAVNDFLRDMLAAPSPSNEGADVRVTEVLDSAARNARQRFAEQPQALLAILRAIGNSYRSLGLPVQARAVLEEGLALSRALQGADSEPSLDLEAILTNVNADSGTFDQAARSYQQMLERTRRLLGDHHRVTIYVALELGSLLSTQRKHADAAQHWLNFALANRPADADADAGMEQRAAALFNLGRLAYGQGDLDRAGALYSEALSTLERTAQGWSLNAEAARQNLALITQKRGDLAQAERQLRALLAASESRLGPSHRNLRTTLLNLGGVLNEQRKYEQAIPILRRAVELGEHHGEARDRALLHARNNLANALAQTGRLDEARPLREGTYAAALRDYGPEHPFTLLTIINLAEQRLLDGDTGGARDQADAAGERARRVLGEDHLFALEAAEVAARARFASGARAPALADLAVLCAAKAKALGADSPHAASCDAHRAELLAASGESAQATALLTEAIERSAARYGEEHPATASLRSRLEGLTRRP